MATLSATVVSSLVEAYFDQVVVLVLVFARLSALVIAAPAFGARSVPVRIRVLMALALSLLVAPLHWGAPIARPSNLLELATMMANEILVGLGLGLGVMILLLGLTLAGHVASHMSGMALADVVDPGLDTSMPVFAQLWDLVSVSVFVLLGGHRMVLDALLGTFRWMPPGTSALGEGALSFLGEVCTQSFALGLRAAAPMILSLLVSVLVLGLISRTLPQLNILAVGLGLNSLMILATMAIGLGAILRLYQDQIEPALLGLGQMFVSTVTQTK